MRFTLLIMLCLPLLCGATVLPAKDITSENVLQPFAGSTACSGVHLDSTVRPLRSKEEFMSRYGTNDTSKAIIRFYFFKAKGYRNFTWLPFIIALPFSIAFLIIATTDPLKSSAGKDGVDAAVIFGFLALISLTVAIPWSIINVIRYRNFRKKLLSVLTKYQQTGKLSQRIARSTLFRVALRGEPANVPWKQPKPAPRAPRGKSKLR